MVGILPGILIIVASFTLFTVSKWLTRREEARIAANPTICAKCKHRVFDEACDVKPTKTLDYVTGKTFESYKYCAHRNDGNCRYYEAKEGIDEGCCVS